MSLSNEAKKKRAEYMRKYRERNKEHIRQYNAEWRKNNPDKVRAAQNRYWERLAEKQEV